MSWQIDRRAFVGAAAAAGIGAMSRGVAARAADEPADENSYAGFKMGIQSYSLRNFDFEKALDHVQALGLSAVELFDAHLPLASMPQELRKARRAVIERKIKIMGHGVNGFSKDHEANKAYFELAKKLEIPTLVADPSEDSFESLDKLVKEYDVRIAIHNHGPGARYDKVVDVLNAIKGHDERIGACADLGHYIRSAEDPVKAIHLFEGRLFGIHLKDFAEQKAETKGVILGEGHLDVKGVFAALRKVNFPSDGALSLEYEENPENPIDDIRACLAAASKGAKESA